MQLLPLVIANVLIGTSANSCMKWSSLEVATNKPYLFVLALALNTASFTIWFFLLQISELATTQSIVSSSMIVASFLAGIFLFGEKVSFLECVGIALALMAVGSIFLARKMSQSSTSSSTFLEDIDNEKLETSHNQI